MAEHPNHPGEGGASRGRKARTKRGKAIRREEHRIEDRDGREVLEIVVSAEGLAGRLRHHVVRPERLTPEALGWIHADLERMLELAEEQAQIGAIGPLLEGLEADAEAKEAGNDVTPSS